MAAEQVDVAIVGAGLCGLACAAALLKVHPGLNVKVYDKRPPPQLPLEDDDDSSSGDARAPRAQVGGAVRLEPNAIRALTAISRRLAASVLAEGSSPQQVVLHDMEGSHALTMLRGAAPQQPALVIGWHELQQLLLQHLPPDTCWWGAEAVAYSDGSTAGSVMTLELLCSKSPPQQHQEQQQQQAAAVSPFALANEAAEAAAAAADTDAPAAAAASQQSGMPAHAAARGGERQPMRVRVRARLLLGTDGACSQLRQQCVGDGAPTFDGVVRFVGRLPADVQATIPADAEAWWLGQGCTFASHPLSCGDVAWEAQVNSARLGASGFAWDDAAQRVVRSGGVGGGGGHSAAVAGLQQQRAAAAAAAPAGPEGDADGGAAILTAGDAKLVTVPAAVAAAAAAAAGGSDSAGDAQELTAQGVLLDIFASFPAAVLSMIALTPSDAVLPALPVHARPARLLPACMGRGAVAVLGQAAHPLRPAGQDVAQALEDAAVLGAAVMAAGVSKQALRNTEVARRARWQHAMQVSAALGSCSSLGGVALQQCLLDYTAKLHAATFVPLRRMDSLETHAHRRQLLRQLLSWAGYGLVAWGAAAGLSVLRPGGRRREQGGGPGRVLGEVAEAAVRAPTQGVAALGKAGAAVERELQQAAGGGGTSNGGGSSDNVLHGAVQGAGRGDGGAPGPLGRARDAFVGGTLAVGGVLSRPFVRIVRHRAMHEMAVRLGVF